MWVPDVSFSDLVGQTIMAIDVENPPHGDHRIKFATNTGELYLMYHCPDCCETVDINEIVGDLEDLIGHPILLAEEVTNREEPKPYDYAESFTWTFYKLSTIKGSVTISWLGESNGYYSEAVAFVNVTPDPKPTPQQ